MVTDGATSTKDSNGRLHRRRRRRRSRNHQHESQSMVRTNRIVEIWIVAAVSLFLLGAGVSWLAFMAHPGSPTPDVDTTVNAVGPGAPNGSEPAVIILQDNSPKPEPSDK